MWWTPCLLVVTTAAICLSLIEGFNATAAEATPNWMIKSEQFDLMRMLKTQAQESQNAAADQIKYYVYTRENILNGEIIEADVESVIRNIYNPLKATVFSIHGWGSSRDSPENRNVVTAKLDQEDCNVIVVDYSKLIDSNVKYEDAVRLASNIGAALADFIKLLHLHFDVAYNQIHLVGFSLGGQIAGLTGKYTQAYAVNGGKIQRITALDPAGPIFIDNKNNDEHLTADDAHFVDVIHTNGDGWGYMPPCGHVDYYPNGGKVQPNCSVDDDGCSHVRAYELIKEMWSSKENNFISAKCTSEEDLSRDHCTWLNVRMGELDVKAGIYYLETNDHYPYAKGSFVTKFL